MNAPITLPFFKLLLLNGVFLLSLLLLLSPWARQKFAGWAVLKRNFVGYFSNPTGYLFILVFVAACSACAFYPHDFFNDNLATLHQLNKYFVLVMLVYIGTITMGVWAEERRQGTDELLLTVPASDWDIVLGKYFAAAAIYTVSLVFSQLANFLVLAILSDGEVDLGLFSTTYLGYWFVGIAMIAVGMVGSFLTRNLTIGFILGVLLNLPLALSSYADAIFSSDIARTVARFSYHDHFLDFGRGVISGRSVIFFALVILLGLYLSVVLVGRRHWWGGKDGKSLVGHYLTRALALLLVAVSLTLVFARRDPWRIDGTAEKVNTLSNSTNEQLGVLRDRLQSADTRSVLVEAFISRELPQEYVQTKVDLVSKLRELEAKGGNRIQVRIYDNLDRYSEEATLAQEQYGIQPTTVMVRERGAIRQDDIFMGVVFTSGLEKVVIPFFDQGIPVEYELLRSICTVTDTKRKRLGILNTDAQLFGGFDMQRMSQTPKQLIVEELEKQYEVVRIDPNAPIREQLDVLLVVQPSSLTQPQMDNLATFVKQGTPTAIFEDPMPVMMNAPGTSQPKMPAGGMMGMGAPPEPKGDIKALWTMLGIRMVGQEQMGQFNADVIWQDYNPYKKARGFRQITKEWVFASPEAPGAESSLNPAERIVSGLQQILLLYPGGIVSDNKPGIDVTPLVSTGSAAGTVPFQDLSSGQDAWALEFKRQGSAQPIVLAARIRTKNAAPDYPQPKPAGTSQSTLRSPFETRFVQATAPPSAPGLPGLPGAPAIPAATPPNAAPPAQETPTKLNVIYVSDIDLMHSEFLRVRAQPNMSDINWKFDNVTFVLNVVDELAADVRFMDVRKKQTRHKTLKFVEARTAEAREASEVEIDGFEQEFKKAEEDAKAKQRQTIAELQSKVDELTKKAEESGSAPTSRDMQRALQSALQQMAAKQEVEQRRLDTTIERLTRDRDSKLQRIERDLDRRVQAVQNIYKGLALFLPMLPPLAVGLVVFLRQRMLESESVTASRRR